jgi:sugar O-acyltransferase (sialic acid O-acetyltransferase NeuD family)
VAVAPVDLAVAAVAAVEDRRPSLLPMVLKVVVLGGGGCGREVLDVIDALVADGAALEVIGVLDDGQPDTDLLSAWGVELLGGTGRLGSLPSEIGVVAGIGSPAARRRVLLAASDRTSPVLVHPAASVAGRNVSIGAGSVVCAGVRIQSHVRIGRHVHINQNATVGHDVLVGNHSVISPLVAVSGNVTLAEECFVGAAAALNPGVRLGAGSVVGSGAAVITDVPARATYVGVPAHEVRRSP